MGLPSQLGSDSVKFMFHIFGEGQDGCEEEVVPSVTSFEVGDLGVSPQRTVLQRRAYVQFRRIHLKHRRPAQPQSVSSRAIMIQYSVFSNCSSTVTVSPSGPRKLFKGVTTAMSGVLARFPLLLPVRNPVAGYGASAVTRTPDRGHVAEVKNQFHRGGGVSIRVSNLKETRAFLP